MTERKTRQNFVVTTVPRWADIDLNQHMRHSAFADWATYARTEWLNANGFTILKLLELRMTPIMFEDRTRYLQGNPTRRTNSHRIATRGGGS